MELAPIQPGKPTQNAYIERCSHTFRGEVLDLYAFGDLDRVRDELPRWLYRCHHDRPHRVLDHDARRLSCPIPSEIANRRALRSGLRPALRP